jgi:hypothetical protein
LVADDSAVHELDEALQMAERSGDDTELGLIKYVLGIALGTRDDAADHQRGIELFAQVREMCVQQRFYQSELPAFELHAARDSVLRGDCESAVPVIRRVLNEFLEAGQLAYGAVGTTFLVEALLGCGTEGDVAEAQGAIDRASKLPPDESLVLRDVWLLRLRALVARARGDDDAYRELADRYGAVAKSLGFEGHIAMAAAM